MSGKAIRAPLGPHPLQDVLTRSRACDGLLAPHSQRAKAKEEDKVPSYTHPGS
jgi:hypothetical protein